jgi:predicted membrane protein
MKITAKIVFGAILIFLGLVFLLDTSGALSYLHISADFLIGLVWPFLLLAFGIKLLTNRSITAGIIFVSFGMLFLLTQLFSWNFFAVLWPIILIAIGLSIIFRNEETHTNMNRRNYDKDKIREDLIFWGIDTNVDSQSFKGGEVNAIFGGGKIDLRNAKIDENGAKLVINAVFGGIELFVPKDCKVVTTGSGILGGWVDHTKKRDTEKPVLKITGSAVFGGIDIKE